ncbi:MAG: hypothetical protein OEV85_12765 [Candidatus Thorarchaeota archaeon]|nr:hypothetical protein [Candidatus Thorarchaeota archaeon]
MQQSSFFTVNLLIFLLFLSAAVFITALRFIAIKRYQSKRRNVEAKSALGSLGDRLSNTPFMSYNVIHPVLYILAFTSGMLLLEDEFSYGSIQLSGAIVLSAILLVMAAYFAFTVGGRMHWRIGRIEADYHAFEDEAWVLQIHLAELKHDTQSSNKFRAKVAKRVIDNLMVKENTTGDAVRLIMSSPEQLQDVQKGRTIPNPLKYFKFSLLLFGAIAITVVIGALGVSVGGPSGYDIAVKTFPLTLVLTVALVCCVCLEGSSANERRRKSQYRLP